MEKHFRVRAWDLKEKKMYYPNELLFRNEGVFCFYTTPTDEEWCNETKYYKLRKLDIRDCIIMETIGLKDKAGKQIFVGDIMLNGKSGWVVVKKGANYVLSDNAYGTGRTNGLIDSDVRAKAEDWEYEVNKALVVGNLFENKELLTRK